MTTSSGRIPTVGRLEECVAALLGKEAALDCPSGTMTNQIGVHVGTGRGDEVLLHEPPTSSTSRRARRPSSQASR